jgi:flagellar basal body-associated protein FliL
MALDVQAPQTNNPAPAPVSGGPSSKGKNAAIVVIVVLVIAVVFVAIWFALKSISSTDMTTPTATTTTETVPVVKDSDDIQKLEDEVRNTDVDGLSEDLEENDKDAADF